jgi:hypothetical protein
MKKLVSDAIAADVETCTFYAAGLCRGASTTGGCSLLHDPLIDPAKIPCRIKVKNGSCKSGPACLYMHQAVTPANRPGPSSSAMNTGNCKPTATARLTRRPPHHAFDSTLGYPGEGPPAHQTTVLGWNITGAHKVFRCLRRAKAKKIDIVLLQETHRRGVSELRSDAKANGYACIASPAPEADPRAGVAIFLRLDGIDTRSIRNPTVHVAGRLLSVEVEINGIISTLYSIYSPSDPTKRKAFITNINITIGPNPIIQGDLNVVKDPKIDSKSQEGAEPYKSLHSHLVERLLAGWGCKDISRPAAR